MKKMPALLAGLLPLPVLACTLWGASGEDVADGGTLISKNRDWAPDHQQILKTVRSKRGYAYFGIFATGNAEPGLKAGTIEKGLTIISASSNIPKKLREQQTDKHGVMARILLGYASIAELSKDADALFAGSHANFFMLSDHRQIMLVEVGLDGRHSIRIIEQGSVAHTNHYLDSALAGQFGDKPGVSSSTRYARINELLSQAPHPLNMEAFATFSRDHVAGPNNSLWRTGHEYTLASWIVATPPEGAPQLRVVIANPGEAESTQEITLDKAFWQSAHRTFESCSFYLCLASGVFLPPQL